MHPWIPWSISIETSMASCNPKVTDVAWPTRPSDTRTRLVLLTFPPHPLSPPPPPPPSSPQTTTPTTPRLLSLPQPLLERRARNGRCMPFVSPSYAPFDSGSCRSRGSRGGFLVRRPGRSRSPCRPVLPRTPPLLLAAPTNPQSATLPPARASRSADGVERAPA
eukprot:352578-Chlamydomonas_euryale.AAC.2